MHFCLTCKEITEPVYHVAVKDTHTENAFEDYVCKSCYERLKSNHHAEGVFALHSAVRWIRWKQKRKKGPAKLHRRGMSA